MQKLTLACFGIAGCVWLNVTTAAETGGLEGYLQEQTAKEKAAQQAAKKRKADEARAERMRRQQEEDDRQAELARQKQIEREHIAREQAAEVAREKLAQEKLAQEKLARDKPASRVSATKKPPLASQPISSQNSNAQSGCPNAADENLQWVNPAEGELIGEFSETGNQKGLEITGDYGTPVVAAAPGEVVYSGTGLRGYGKLILIKHNATFFTAYAHNSKLLVKLGQKVEGGEQIAEMGNTEASRVELYFELRKCGNAVDPKLYLPMN